MPIPAETPPAADPADHDHDRSSDAPADDEARERAEALRAAAERAAMERARLARERAERWATAQARWDAGTPPRVRPAEASAPEPQQAVAPQPAPVETGVAEPEPEVAAPEPEVAAPEPEVAAPVETEVAAPEPEVAPDPEPPRPVAEQERAVPSVRSSSRWRRLAGIGAVVLGLVFAWRLVAGGDDPVIRLLANPDTGGSQANALVVEGGTASISSLRSAANRLGQGGAVVSEGDNTFRLTVPVIVASGGTLELENATVRLASGPGSYVAVEARGGTVRIDKATLVSWDDAAGGPDRQLDDGRAFLLATARATLELDDATVQALGYDAPGRTGASWLGAGTGGHAQSSRFVENQIGATVESTAGVAFTDGDFERSAGAGLRIAGGNDIEVSGSRLHANGEVGISAFGVRDLVIRDDVVSGNHVGVLIDAGTQAKLDENRLTGNRAAGVWVQGDSSTATLQGNRLDHNGGAGVLVAGGRTVVGPGDQIADNAIGIRVEDATPDVTVSDSDIQANADVGVSFLAAQGLRLTGNRIIENGSAPFAVRTRHESVPFASANTILPSQLGWEIVRRPGEAPPPTLTAPPAIDLGAPPGAQAPRPA